jgi:hypothetical protein
VPGAAATVAAAGKLRHSRSARPLICSWMLVKHKMLRKMTGRARDRGEADMKSIAVSALIVLLGSLDAAAQSRSFYDANGSYGGSAVTSGGSTSYYGPNGNYQGTAVTGGGSRSFYGPGGSYQGSSTTRGNTTSYYGPGGGYLGSATRSSPTPALPLR